MASIDKNAYAHMFGPTVGDRVRLADTDLWLEVEKILPNTVKKLSLVAEKLFVTAWDKAKPRVLKR